MYVVVREDIPVADQAVQACHATIAAASSYAERTVTDNLVLCGVSDEAELLETSKRLELEGIPFRLFHEPDLAGQATALATEPVDSATRRHFRHLRLLAPPAQVVICRQPRWSPTPLYYRATWDVFFMLKNLKRWYWQSQRDLARWRRWTRKTVHRVGESPNFCSALFGCSADAWFLTLFEQVREPSPSPVATVPPSDVALIKGLYSEARDWYAAERNEPDPFVVRAAKHAAQ